MEERDQVQKLYKSSLREKIAAGMASLRAGRGIEGEVVMARLKASLSAIQNREQCGVAITISQHVLADMIAEGHKAAECEACGLLLGTGSHIEHAVPTANVAPDPARHFEIDPVALIAAHRAARDGSGPQVLGYFHSHPNGLARPSATDAQCAARDGRVWVIVASGAITCWCDGSDGFEPLSYAVTEG